LEEELRVSREDKTRVEEESERNARLHQEAIARREARGERRERQTCDRITRISEVSWKSRIPSIL
jgi:hypothetical protein